MFSIIDLSWGDGENEGRTYSEMFSNSNCVSRLLEALLASSFPVQSLGPAGWSAQKHYTLILLRGIYHTSQDHQLSTVLVAEAILALSGQDVGGDLSEVLR